MNGHRAIKINESGHRCDHHYCDDCSTKRGRNRGNRRIRRIIKVALRKLNSEE